MSEVSLKRFYFVLFDDGLTLKTLKLAFIGFLSQTLHIDISLAHTQRSAAIAQLFLTPIPMRRRQGAPNGVR